MKTTIKKLSLLLFACSLVISAKSQVTIGMDQEPARGAILDLKQNEADDGKATSTMGLKLPRVALTSLTSLAPLVPEDATDYDAQKNIHKGTLVYNVTDNDAHFLEEGIYSWNGGKWVIAWNLGGNTSSNDDAFIGTTNDVGLKFKVGDTERMRITTGGNVGIGISNGPDIKAKLHVGGDVMINDLPPTSEAELHQVVADNQGKLYKVSAAGDNAAAFNYLIFKISNPGGGGDQVARYGTGIPSAAYTLIVVGYHYTTGIKDVGIVPANINGVNEYSPLYDKINAYGTTVAANVYAKEENGQWHICADYAGGGPAKGYETVPNPPAVLPEHKPVWTIYCIAINNAMVKAYDEIDVDLKGATSGDSNKNPLE